MPTSTLDLLIRKSLSTVVATGQPFTLATVLSAIQVVPPGFVIDTCKASDSLLKAFFTSPSGYSTAKINDEIVFVPNGMSTWDAENILFPKPPPVAKRRIFYNFCKPTTQGRIRVPVRVMKMVAQPKSSVWMVKKGETARIYSYRPRTAHPNEAEKYSTDCYGNLLFLAPNPDKDYAFSVSRGVITASPV